MFSNLLSKSFIKKKKNKKTLFFNEKKNLLSKIKIYHLLSWKSITKG